MHGADLIPDGRAVDVLLSHAFRGPNSPIIPAEEAVVSLGLDASRKNFLGLAVGRGGFGEVCSVFHGPLKLFALVMHLGWDNRRLVFFQETGCFPHRYTSSCQ